jgi:tripartite-type tricarboxylate transporter receptor subunit TctC
MMAYLKANPDKVNQAHAGVGAVSHMTCIMFNSQLGIKPTAVPYSGTGPALNDLVSGQVDYMCDQIVNLVQQVKAGAIKAYAIATPVRSPALPDLPTTIEAGMPDYQVTAWNAIFAPKDTPKEIVTALTDALGKALDDEATKGRLLELGGVLPTKDERGGKWLGEFVTKEVARWTPVLKDAPK